MKLLNSLNHLGAIALIFGLATPAFAADAVKKPATAKKAKSSKGGKKPAAQGPATPTNTLAHADLMKMVLCATELNETLTEWGARKDWRFAGHDLDGAKIFRSPSKDLGIWTEVKVFSDRSVDAIKMSANESLRATWNARTCRPAIKTDVRTFDPKRQAIAFTDAKLKALFESRKQGMIYVWSPMMPHSINGLPEAIKVGESKGLHVTVLLDPYADGARAREALKGVPGASKGEYYAPMESLELIMRDMTLHYPSLILYRDGAFASPYLPGYETPEQLAEFIDNYLSK